MGRPSNWKSPTAAIRVPTHAVGAVLALAKQLDNQPSSFVQNPGPYLVTVNEAQYLVTAPADCPPEIWAEADRLIDELIAPLAEKDQLYMLARLTEELGRPINA